MKVYFTASSRGRKTYGKFYGEIFNLVERLGHKHLDDLVITNKNLYQGTHEDQVALYRRSLELINSSDVVILEVSLHSLSMGYVMHKALDIGKPVIALYAKGCEPYYALGIQNDRLQVIEYDEYSLEDLLKSALEYSGEQMDTRFNFFISPTISAYLDWIAKRQRVPRAVYLRNLIVEDMKKQKEFSLKK